MQVIGEWSRILVCQFVKESFDESDTRKELADEMTDVLWVPICLANLAGVDFTKALDRDYEKKNIRDITRHCDNNKLQ
jgi:NTP pyrophosphatase (non-canonical NTP hydrolase)